MTTAEQLFDKENESPAILGDRILYLMEKHKINAAILSRDTGIPNATLNRLLHGVMDDPKLSILKSIANYFSISIDELLNDKSKNALFSKENTNFAELPIISWKNSIKYKDIIPELNKENWAQWILTEKTFSSNSYALVTKRYMEPQFPTGALLIIDPNAEIMNYDLVLVHYEGTSEPIIEEIIFEGSNILYRNINGEEIKSNLNEKKIILGVVMNTIISYNKDRNK